jgi:uncharacterized membrane protein YhiD involved in acid resistance
MFQPNDQVISVFPPTQIATKILIALGVGLLVGLEREWARKDVGLRTFSLTALLGWSVLFRNRSSPPSL